MPTVSRLALSLPVLAFAVACPLATAAPTKHPAYTDPAQTDEDFPS